MPCIDFMQWKIGKMSNEDIYNEYLKCSRDMEKGNMNKTQIAWAKTVFIENAYRTTDVGVVGACTSALRVLKLFES